jgi:hypothetical protein
MVDQHLVLSPDLVAAGISYRLCFAQWFSCSLRLVCGPFGNEEIVQPLNLVQELHVRCYAAFFPEERQNM